MVFSPSGLVRMCISPKGAASGSWSPSTVVTQPSAASCSASSRIARPGSPVRDTPTISAGPPKPADHGRPARQPLLERPLLPPGPRLVAGPIGELRDRLPPAQLAYVAPALRNGLPHPDQAQIEADSHEHRGRAAHERTERT